LRRGLRGKVLENGIILREDRRRDGPLYNPKNSIQLLLKHPEFRAKGRLADEKYNASCNTSLPSSGTYTLLLFHK
jgi:hypothetical protein